MRTVVALAVPILLLPAALGQQCPCWRGYAVVWVLEAHGEALGVFRPYLGQIALWACEPDGWGDRWDHVYYGPGGGGLPDTVEYYYARAAEHLRRSELEEAARYLAYALSYLLDAYNPFNTYPGADRELAEKYRELLDANIGSILSRIDPGSLKVEAKPPREIVEEAARLSRRLYPELEEALRKGDYDRAYEIAFSLVKASVEGCLGLISQLPLSAFERVLYTPALREAFYASLALLAAGAAYMAYGRAQSEEEVEAAPEGLP